ncbi:futalosine hydrolase [Paenibacillus sp. GCM10012307]|uniref:Futalosine hydrolase n=1 Tax=Paenibacillus roseus TaxID=2798579 RepID=A0A934J6P2_9BACL|nr:futalosine hydrolase [Paenibacillus roseus]MBJ6362734.1 futalosine hydrolase [Paenibacillus roseus]
MKTILVLTAVEAEREAVMRGLGEDSRFEVAAAGVGAAAAAASAAARLAVPHHYELVVAAGIAGGFTDRAAVGTLVVADHIVAADLGAASMDGFLSLDELGFGSSSAKTDIVLSPQLASAIGEAGLTCALGPVLTVSTATGTAEGAAELKRRVPNAAAEAMEGYGIAVAAKNAGLPVLELRAISNQVGPRNREAWRIKDALDALSAASSILREVL